MPASTELRELPDRLAEALLAYRTSEVIVTHDSVPMARLTPFALSGPRIPGLHAGAIQATDDFDEPLLDDFWTGKV